MYRVTHTHMSIHICYSDETLKKVKQGLNYIPTINSIFIYVFLLHKDYIRVTPWSSCKF